MTTASFLLSLLSLLSALRDTPAAPATAAPTAADYLARTAWVCHMPPDDKYAAHRCSPDALNLPCTAQWLSRCEPHGGTLELCGPDRCPSVYTGRRDRQPKGATGKASGAR
jgi:hypothetical protein